MSGRRLQRFLHKGAALQLASLLALLMPVACTDPAAGAGASSAGAALNFDRLRCASRTGRRTCALYNASVAELIANPREFHGKPVRLVGYLHIEPEANALYVGETDYVHTIDRNGLWLAAPPGADSLSDGYVIVEATFDASSQGEFGKWSGTLRDVTHLSRWTGARSRTAGTAAPVGNSQSSRSP